jgi:hypothetical protein
MFLFLYSNYARTIDISLYSYVSIINGLTDQSYILFAIIKTSEVFSRNVIDNHSFWYRSVMFFKYHTMSLFHFSINSTTSIISISSLLLSGMYTHGIKYFEIFFIYKHEFAILDVYLVMISLVNCAIFNDTKINIGLFCEL